jgi:Pyruvate/2-oxoacid:ferredoxin oxidoreductase delta subunit
MKRNVITIDDEKCNGCGACILACPEGALQIVDGKARLVKASFCDGLGACLGECPEGALIIEQQEVDVYDEDGVIAHIRETSPQLLEKHLAHLREHAAELPLAHSRSGVPACPSAQVLRWEGQDEEMGGPSATRSELRQWPVQLHLVPPDAPYLRGADFVLVADCVPFAYANFHADFMKNKAIAIGCPKLDDVDAYIEKVTRILQQAGLKSLTVVHMEVPCCRGLVQIARWALKRSGKDLPIDEVVISIDGRRKDQRDAPALHF